MEEDGTLASLARLVRRWPVLFCSIMPPLPSLPPPEAGQNGLCNYVWHGMTEGGRQRLRGGREANNVVIYNQSPSFAARCSLVGSAKRE